MIYIILKSIFATIEAVILKKDITKFQKTIWSFYKKSKWEFPWRETTDPYKILVSEIMLQQTQVARVIPKYEQFIKAFPKTITK